jgi:hypothetical protein
MNKFGNVNIEQDITVLPADNGNYKLNWYCYEEQGCEIFKALKGWGKIFIDLMPDGYITEALEKRYTIKGLKDINVGDVIVVSHFFGLEEVKITKIDYDKAEGLAESETTLYPLEYSKRRGWINSMMINKNCIAKLKAVKTDFDV